jgi:hypothetical protein
MSDRRPEHKRKRTLVLALVALGVGGVVAVGVVGGLNSSSRDSAKASPTASEPSAVPPGAVAHAKGPYRLGRGAVIQRNDGTLALVQDPPPPSGRKFVHYETASDKVTVRETGEGFEIINTDVSLAGQQMEITGVTEDGERVTYMVAVPNPPASALPPVPASP